MRIVVNNIAANTGGAMTVLKDFYSCVCENDKENEWIFLLSDKYFEETENVRIIAMPEIKKSPIKKVIFDFFTGRNFINKLKPDIVFSMQNIITFGVNVPQIIYLHQSLPFQNVKKFSFLNQSERGLAFKQCFVGAIIKKSVKKAKSIIVQTQWMKEAVCQKCGIDEQKVIKITPNVNKLTKNEGKYLFDCTYFFYPTSTALYKNNGLVFEASRLLDEKGIKHSVELTLSQAKTRGNVKCIDRIPYDKVIERYNYSTLIFPSYIETFGYPLAEARQLGAIILAADTPFSRELLKDYENAFFFDYCSAEQLAGLMEKVIKGEIIKKKANNTHTDKSDCWFSIMKFLLCN